jgi:hypothetical protein
LGIAALSQGSGQIASAATCTPTGFFRDGINLTAAQIGGDVTTELDATGCNIGVYYDAITGGGNVDEADIHGANYFGVVNRGTDVDVTDSEIHDIGETPFNGAQHGVAVYYATVDVGSAAANGACTDGSTTGTIAGNSVYDYQKGGIVVSCDGANVMVIDNHVTGLGAVAFIAQNGIQFGYGAQGQIRNNVVDGGHDYTPGGWTATGILIFESDGVIVQRNQLSYNQTGIAVETWCWFEASASNNKIDNNEVIESTWGITVAAYDLYNYSTCDASANNNKVINNEVASTDGSDGVFVGSGAYWYPGENLYDPAAANNKLIHNVISGFDSPISQDGDTDSKVHANVVAP